MKAQSSPVVKNKPALNAILRVRAPERADAAVGREALEPIVSVVRHTGADPADVETPSPLAASMRS